jgi:hypothetical protein
MLSYTKTSQVVRFPDGIYNIFVEIYRDSHRSEPASLTVTVTAGGPALPHVPKATKMLR